MIEPATPADNPVLERLWQLYAHDLSEFRDSHPNEEGLFKRAKLEPFLVPDDDRAAYLFRRGGRPAGFALVSGLAAELRWVDQFFVVRSMRRSGVGREAAAAVLRRHPGRWRIGFQNENPKAARFWRRLAAELGSDVSEELQPVPGKPHIPHDVLLTATFT
ncbi:MAG TPA: GNAT family N-acetyltransferase [Gaiellaceae bacterium]|jgi:predicted acetyltransferase|nr:GNAT family N-acetyltransferase [Gaiellaceae bacterium]